MIGGNETSSEADRGAQLLLSASSFLVQHTKKATNLCKMMEGACSELQKITVPSQLRMGKASWVAREMTLHVVVSDFSSSLVNDLI